MSTLKEQILSAHELAERIFQDETRPKYHFRVPFDLGFPADPNAMFYADGLYHLMFIYESRADSYRWGHATSVDLLHWQFHADALVPDESDGGIYSGGVLLEEDGRAVIAYWALGKDGSAGGIRIAESAPSYETWKKHADYAVACKELGVTEVDGKPVGCADPSNLFKVGGTYCMQLGNLCLLDKFRGDESHPEYQGDWSELFVSDDLRSWRYKGRFYERLASGGTDPSEDCMCPYFAPLPNRNGADSGVWLQLFISHNRGCQYYLGEFDRETLRFLPKKHGRLAVADNALFAPEVVKTPDGRLAMLCWMRDNLDDDLERELKKGWSGVYCLPRELSLDEDGDLRVLPLRETDRLRYQPERFSVTGERELALPLQSEIVFEIPRSFRGRAGVKISAESGEIEIVMDTIKNELSFDTRRSGTEGRKVRETVFVGNRTAESLRVYSDGCVLDAFAGGRALTRQIFLSEKRKTIIFAEGGTLEGSSFRIAPTNGY